MKNCQINVHCVQIFHSNYFQLDKEFTLVRSKVKSKVIKTLIQLETFQVNQSILESNLIFNFILTNITFHSMWNNSNENNSPQITKPLSTQPNSSQNDKCNSSSQRSTNVWPPADAHNGAGTEKKSLFWPLKKSGAPRQAAPAKEQHKERKEWELCILVYLL